MQTISERIRLFTEKQEVKITVLEREINASKGVLSRSIKNNTDIQSKWVSKIVENYPQINSLWLLTGEGNMLNEEKEMKEINTIQSSSSTIQPSISTNKGVPYYDIDFIGGFDLVVNDSSIQPNFYIDFNPFNDADYWVNITGKSMSPFISHGDMVALKRFESWRDFILYGEIYAIVTDDFRTIKIVGQGADNDHLSLIPYNKSIEFSKQDIPKRLIRNIFKVKGSIKKFF